MASLLTTLTSLAAAGAMMLSGAVESAAGSGEGSAAGAVCRSTPSRP